MCYEEGTVNNEEDGLYMSAFFSPKWRLTTQPRSEKTGLRGFRPGPTQTGLCSHRRWLEA